MVNSEVTQHLTVLISVSDPYIAVDENHRVIFANPSAEKLFAYNEGELLEQPLDQLFQQGKGMRKDGQKVALLHDHNPLEIGGFKGSLYKFQLPHLENPEELLRLVVESFPLGMLLVNGQGIIQAANQKVSSIFGYEDKELVGETVEILLPPAIRKRHVEYREEYMSQGTVPRMMGFNRDLYGMHKSGSTIPVEVGLNPVTIADEKFVICALLDISERKKQEEQRGQLIRSLEKNNIELEEFTHQIAYYMQEPLRRVESFSFLLKDEFGHSMPEEAQDYTDQIRLAAQNGIALLANILKLSIILSGQKSFAQINLNDLLQQLLNMLKREISICHAEVKVSPLLEIEGDEEQLMQLFRKLIENALKFRDQHRPLQIQISGEAEEDFYHITVEDNGIGIPPSNLTDIFSLFYRLHGEGEYEGIGFGLSLCKKIVQQHQGEIEAKSEVGVGTSIHIKLPFKQEGARF